RTPTLGSGCLAGITRALVLEWYGGVEVDEPIEVMAEATEAFLTSTTRDVQGISRWDDRELTAPGPVTQEVVEVWRKREPELLGL
ncbi:MAG TPA: aminotransferase class IV, partial [Nocardioides sp.]|nr:aminotransferase class IV [Nocardioides sp.]